MTKASASSLVILSALFWYGGGIVLLFKGMSLILEARRLDPGIFWPGVVLAAGGAMGGIKARYLFSRSCKKNLSRINALVRPRWWQFFRPVFLIFLVLMIAAGATLSRLSQGNYPFLLLVALLDFSIAVGLLGSSFVFWRNSYASQSSTIQGKPKPEA